MIRIISLSFILCFSLIFSTAYAKTTIAVAPFNSVVENSDMGKSRIDVVQNSPYAKEGKALEKEFSDFNAKVQEFQKQASALAESARMEKGRALEQTAKSLEKKRNDFTQKMIPIEKKINQQIIDIITEACKNLSKAHGYDIILDQTPPVMYATDKVNIEESLLKEINKVWDKKGGKFNI